MYMCVYIYMYVYLAVHNTLAVCILLFLFIRKTFPTSNQPSYKVIQFECFCFLLYYYSVHSAQTKKSFLTEGTPFIYEYRINLCGLDETEARCHTNVSFGRRPQVSGEEM